MVIGPKKLIVFLVFLALLVGGLRLMNWIPLVISTTTVRAFPGVEQAQRETGLGGVPLPTFFPERIAWPPDEVYGGARPGRVLLLQFSQRETGATVLAISYRDDVAPTIPSRIEPVRIVGTAPVFLKGVRGTLRTGFCADRGACNEVTWERGTLRTRVLLRGPSDELVKIAASMIAD